MKITTLYKAKSAPQFFTTQHAAIMNSSSAVLPYPAVELDNGTFRLIDSDAIVAADREVTLFEPSVSRGQFFLSLSAGAAELLRRGIIMSTWTHHQAIPLPDGTYRRVREGDVVRLWEPEKPAEPVTIYEAIHSLSFGTDTVHTGCFFLSYDDARCWARRKCKCAGHAVFGTSPSQAIPIGATGQYQLIHSGREVTVRRSAKELIAEDEAAIAAVAAVASFGATQAAPESVECDLHKKNAAEFFGIPYEDVTPEQKAFAKRSIFPGMYGKAGTGKTAVTATPESQAGAEQETIPNLWGPWLDKMMEDLDKKKVSAIAVAAKTILSLPAGPARAEAKLKLIGEISKL